MEDGRIPKDILSSMVSLPLVSDVSALGFMDSCKRDLEPAQIGIESWESVAVDRNNWRQDCTLYSHHMLLCGTLIVTEGAPPLSLDIHAYQW